MNNGMVQIDIVFDTRTGALQMRRPPNVAPLLAMLILNTAMRGILESAIISRWTNDCRPSFWLKNSVYFVKESKKQLLVFVRIWNQFVTVFACLFILPPITHFKMFNEV